MDGKGRAGDMAVTSSAPVVALRRAFPVLLGIGLFALGLFALLHLLKPVNLDEVMAHARATPPAVLLAAVLGTAVAYAALVGYDVLALRFIGRRLPGRVVALGGFLAYAFGNTIGVAVVSGGAVRYRIYSAFGLNALEVATVSGYIAVALGTGLTLIGLAALAVQPHVVTAVLPLAPEVIRWGSTVALVASLAVILWISWGNRSVRIWKLELRLPSPRNLAGQLAVMIVDVVAAAFTLWVLMPAGVPDFAFFVAIYSIGMMVGILSHVPGGVGVFEAVVISTMPPDVPVSEVAAALLMFRMIYYLLPFVLGFLLVALNELRMAGGAISRWMGAVPAPMRPLVEAVHGIVPSLTALVTFGFGTYLLLVSLIPSVRGDAVEDLRMVAALLREGGTLLLAILGVMLLILSDGLGRRIKSAFWLTLTGLGAGAVASLLNDFDYRNAALLAAVGVALLPFRRSFYRQAKLTDAVFSPAWFALVITVLAGAGGFFFFVHRAPQEAGDLQTVLHMASDADRALRAGLLASALVFLFSIYMATRPMRLSWVVGDDPAARERAAAIVAAAEQPRGCLALSGDKRLLFSEPGGAFLMFTVQGKTWVTLGDPVGRAQEFADLCWSFADLARRANALPVFYAVEARRLPIYAEMGLLSHHVGDEAVIRLRGLHLWTEPFAPLREMSARWQAAGASLELIHPPHAPALLAELEAVSGDWLASRAGREKGFTVGRFSADYLNRFDLAVVRQGGQVVGFANLLAPGGGKRVALDLMRMRADAPEGFMDFLFLGLIERYRDLGAESLSLGMAPPEGLEERSVERLWSRFGSFIYRHGAAFPSFEALRDYKARFGPDWRPLYIAVPPGLSPSRAMTNVALIIAGGHRALVGRLALRRRGQDEGSVKGALQRRTKA